jgi:hypothetical protein
MTRHITVTEVMSEENAENCGVSRTVAIIARETPALFLGEHVPDRGPEDDQADHDADESDAGDLVPWPGIVGGGK